jgi:hypothetical protein
MMKSTRYLTPLLLAGVLVSAPACAAGIYPQRFPTGDRDDRVYYNRGFSEGRESGIDDARRGRSFDMRRHDEYRDIDRRRGMDRDDVRVYRQGFEAGYEEGYRSFARGGGYGYPPRTIPPQSRQDPYYGGGGARGRFGSPAAQNGYRDGLEQGQRDARKGDRFDPVRAKQYRQGDHDYDRRYGSRDDYKRDYRAGFQQGYDEGYRGYRR